MIFFESLDFLGLKIHLYMFKFAYIFSKLCLPCPQELLCIMNVSKLLVLKG